MEEVKSLAKGNTENNGEIIWRALEDPEAGEDNVYHFSMQIF